jgi:putative aminopeptidase FrvX
VRELSQVLRSLLTAPGPSGFEQRAAAAFRDACEPLAEVTTDHVGSVVAKLAGTRDAPSTAIMGHIDEIGLIVSHIDDDGFLWFLPIGGWDPVILVGQRLEVVTRNGIIPGVVGKKPIHLLREEERKEPPKGRDLHMDIGAKDGDEARSMVSVGDVAVIAAEPLALANGRVVSRSMDNRLGCYVAYETLRQLHESADAPGDVYAVAAAQEETTFQGSITTTYTLQPDLAIVIDVTHATDAPGIDEKENGRHHLGSGPAIVRGSNLSPRMFERLVEAAEAEGIPYTGEATGRATATDADAVTVVRAGVPTASIGVPLRYMHSTVEMVQLDDVYETARLCAAFVRRLTADASFAR